MVFHSFGSPPMLSGAADILINSETVSSGLDNRIMNRDPQNGLKSLSIEKPILGINVRYNHMFAFIGTNTLQIILRIIN